MGGRADLGLVVTARFLPCAILLFSRYSAEDLALHRRTLRRISRGDDLPDDEVEDSIIEGTQGLGGLAIGGVILGAVFIWASGHALYVPFSVLGAVSTGVLTFAGTLAAIYGARAMWRRPRLLPRRRDFWIAAGCGLLAAALVLAARLTAG
ncbi:MAG TPA: hypothetical protein VGR06_09050 [Actinophytocola sp.]|jgi:hypothetical protein|uniref:hypothetical protein n=1 Tax=Actinophytocola sp. TaxID=1872138 RepID=UPI002DFBA1C6|nr:hypothetical protein [Actinophytocola sp.]